MACGLCGRGAVLAPLHPSRAPKILCRQQIPSRVLSQDPHRGWLRCPQAGSVPVSPSAAIAPPPDREQTRHLRCGRTAPEFQGGKTKAVSGGVSQHGIAVPWEFPSPFFTGAPSARWKGTPAAHPGTRPRAQHPEMGGEASSGGCPGIQPGDFGTCRWRCPT